MFRHYLRVRYGECDAQKVVFNSRYADYVDVAVNEFLKAAGLEHEMVHGPYDFQLVKQTVEWKGSARFDEVLEISVSARRLGKTSFTLGPRHGKPAFRRFSPRSRPSMSSSMPGRWRK
jgi:acyl-CoA thioester hydrolase